MSKLITSPVKRFPGTVTLADPLTFPQAIAWEKSLAAAREADSIMQANGTLLPGILACVERWEIAGIDNPQVETFPATPAKAIAELLSWLVGEISRLFTEAEGGDPLP